MMGEKNVAPARKPTIRLRQPVTKIQWLLIFGLTFLFIIAITLIKVFRQEVTWQLHLTAQTESVQIDLIAPAPWNVGRALICVPATQADTSDTPDNASACGSSSWRPLPAPGTKLLRVLELRGDEKHPIEVTISSGPSVLSKPLGLVQMTLRRDTSLGVLRETADVVLQLPSEMNLFWRHATHPDDAATTVLPFSGTTTVGHYVNSNAGEMLHSGNLAVFAASDEALTGRSLAEQSALALGDYVTLGAVPEANGDLVFPKGFVRFTSLKPKDDIKVIDVAMFARAEGVKVDRYGGGDFSFEANWWVRIKHQSTVVIAVVLLTGFVTLISALLNIIQAVPDITRWMRRPE